jgi:hypothetical protein
VNIDTMLIASGQNIKRLVAARERGPRKLAQAAALRPPDPVSRCRPHLTRWRPSFVEAEAYFNRLSSLEKLSDKSFCHHRAPASGGTKVAETALLAPFRAPSRVHSEPLLELSDSF